MVKLTYKILYYMMVIGYFGVAVQAPTLKLKLSGLLLTAVNAILFW